MINNNDWWKSATIYQIYPKSFMDSNSDGIGDLSGIISKIPYLKKLGVDAIWITPIYPSPQNDNGYDIKDYISIDPVYGTIDDFKTLVQILHDNNMKLILDIVVNHTSTEHKWFLEAKKSKNNSYRDYYIWREGKNNQEPNNWISKFGGSAWSYNEATNDYYLHLFDKTQADLNWENKKVIEEVVNIMNFWADFGVDGFRLDVINLISKNQEFPNDEKGDGRSFYTDGSRVHEYLKILNEKVFRPRNIFTVGEMSSTNIANSILYSNPDEKELSSVFNFHHLKIDYKNNNKWEIQKPDFKVLKDIFYTWQVSLQKNNGWMSLFFNNHDQPRSVSRYGMWDNERNRILVSKMLAVILYGMRGTTYIYQGEEIGFPNPKWNDISELKDVESINYYNILIKQGLSNKEALEIINLRSRDNSRIPIAWNSKENGGFSKVKPWLKVLSEYPNINVEKALEDKDSIFYFYQKLIAFRKQEKELIIDGIFIPINTSNDNIFAYKRESKNQTLFVVANLVDKINTLDLNLSEIDISNSIIIISNYNTNLSLSKHITLKPQEAIIFKITH